MAETKSKSVPQIYTRGLIAQILNVPVHRIEYILETRRHIRPRGIAGRTRLYDYEAVAMIRHELAAIEARREGRHD